MILRLQRKDKEVKKVFNIPGDKSIAHRSLIIGALGRGEYTIKNFPKNLDCLSTIKCMEILGVKVKNHNSDIYVKSPGYENFNKEVGILNAGNSGTTARLLSGVLAGCSIEATIDGDESLRTRPMARVILPLKQMGANIYAKNNILPIYFNKNKKIKGIEYIMPVASAQVKSSLLIAGFLGNGITTLIEKQSTRDHSERMFKALGVDIKINNSKISISNSSIFVRDMVLPGDISSAAFLIGYALLHEDCNIKIDNILLNERRKKYIDILLKMNANIEYKVLKKENYEEVGYIIAKSSNLKGITIKAEEIPNIIDEIPILAVLACFADGNTIFNGIDELRYKESNRIMAIADNLKECDVEISYSESYLEITGNNKYFNKDIVINPFNDHRIAMAFAAISSRNYKSTVVNNWECTNISFPDSLKFLREFFNVE
jgi:3-phosphoshikimate 1-carboxyvinyltransferase